MISFDINQIIFADVVFILYYLTQLPTPKPAENQCHLPSCYICRLICLLVMVSTTAQGMLCTPFVRKLQTWSSLLKVEDWGNIFCLLLLAFFSEISSPHLQKFLQDNLIEHFHLQAFYVTSYILRRLLHHCHIHLYNVLI